MIIHLMLGTQLQTNLCCKISSSVPPCVSTFSLQNSGWSHLSFLMNHLSILHCKNTSNYKASKFN